MIKCDHCLRFVLTIFPRVNAEIDLDLAAAAGQQPDKDATVATPPADHTLPRIPPDDIWSL